MFHTAVSSKTIMTFSILVIAVASLFASDPLLETNKHWRPTLGEAALEAAEASLEAIRKLVDIC